MYLADYHTHSKYSFDGCEEIENMCEAAIKAGLSEIAITDHMDIFTKLPYGTLMKSDDPQEEPFIMQTAALYDELEAMKARYEGRLKVRIGSELGQPQVQTEASAAFLKDYGSRLDFVIGSVHNMEDDLDVYFYDFDKVDVPAMYERYVDWLIEMTEKCDFDVCGHLTYPLRYLYERKGERLDLAPYEEKFRYLFKLLTESGRGIEMNVSGMYKAMKETMPPVGLLKLYRECGGEIITIGSDAHQAHYIGCWQKEGQELLRSLGFKYITIFEKRKPDFISIR